MSSSIWTVRAPLTPWARAWLMVLAFALPLGFWCLVSYVPFIWHPQVLVESPGDARVKGTYDYLAEGQRVELEVFEKRNQELSAAGAAPQDMFHPNDDKWSGEHASSDVAFTPGILFCNKPIVGEPAIVDLGVTALNYLGRSVPASFEGKPLLREE